MLATSSFSPVTCLRAVRDLVGVMTIPTMISPLAKPEMQTDSRGAVQCVTSRTS